MLDVLELKTIAQTVLHATSKILKDVEVIIVDQNGNYLTQDSTYTMRKKTKEWKPYIDELIRRKEVTVIDNPGLHPLCKGCENEGDCPQKLEISVPFSVDDFLLGYMSVVSFSEETKKEFLKNQEDVIYFLNTMIEIMVSASREHIEKKKSEEMFLELNGITNSMGYGVVDCLPNGNIKYCNDVFFDQIGHRPDVMGKNILDYVDSRVIREVIEKQMALDEQEDLVTFPDEMHRIWIKSIPIKNEKDQIMSFVFIIRSSEELRSLVFNHNAEIMNDPLDQIVGKSTAVTSLKEKIKLIASSSSTVLVKGETGTGKELVARAIHLLGERKNKPFITVNCAAIPDNLLESELFGYEDGAFTGARKGGKPGLFEIANSGVLFLDEIGDMPLHLQAKLLRVLQDREVIRIGGHNPTKLDIRVIAATHQNLDELMQARQFREDLYYRLNIIPIVIQPLRERIEDLNELIYHFIEKYNQKLDKQITGVEVEFNTYLIQYPWPGNVRELENAIEYAINMETTHCLSIGSLIPKIREYYTGKDNNETLKEQLAVYEAKIIVESLRQLKSKNLSILQIAEKLGLSRASLYRKLKEYGLNIDMI